ncbi:hypothetical protein PybrP1_011525 [[Pythium] brassicae (nom. inval.)]|nr:hypothetical protein PybrP1_011525 [[Pythium] brassicae (nom. inval.)]
MCIDVFPGSGSDKKMWMPTASSFRLRKAIPPGTHILGGAEHTLYSWLLTPYSDRGGLETLDEGQRYYNSIHSSTRMTTALGESTGQRAAGVVGATAVLHNIFIRFEDGTNIESEIE